MAKFEMHVDTEGRVQFRLLDELTPTQVSRLRERLDQASRVTVDTTGEPGVLPCEVIVLRCDDPGGTS